MPKYTSNDNNTIEIQCTVKPKGATNLVDDSGDNIKGVDVKFKADMKIINPDNVDIPEGVLNLAIRSIIIDYQRVIRESVTVGSLSELETFVSKDLDYTPGVTVSRTKKSTVDVVSAIADNLSKITNNKISDTDILRVIRHQMSEQEVVEKYKTNQKNK